MDKTKYVYNLVTQGQLYFMFRPRRYLHHTQKSVFEGEITEAKFLPLHKELGKIIRKESDQVRFFRIANKNNVKKENLGLDFDPTSSII